MKFSELWLREWINLDINIKTLADQLTMLGLEVSDIKPVANQFFGVVIGRILECHKHSIIKNLQIIKVDIGEKYLLDIACTALNCRNNLTVVVATINSSIFNDIITKTNKIYNNKLLQGMLCSYFDLGMSYNDNNNIIELPENAPIGSDIRDYLKLNDNIIDIKITSNRGDCFSLIGIIREIAIINRLPFLQFHKNKVVIPTIKDSISIQQINIVNVYSSYFSRIIKNIDVNVVTPLWIKERLRRSDIKTIDIITDMINYILIELGQPINIFDLNKIHGDIYIRLAKLNETLIFNNKKIILTPDTLIISDNNKPLAVAGVFNDDRLNTSSVTHNILLGCAFFDPLSVIHNTHLYNIHTDISHRYEHGVDPNLQQQAIEYVTELLVTICGGQPGPITNNSVTATLLPKPVNIILHKLKLKQLLGYSIKNNEIKDILLRVGCRIFKIKCGWRVLVPSWRFDIKIEEDLIEEIARIYGYEKIPNLPIYTNLETPIHKTIKKISLLRIKMLLADRGYYEAITYSFVNPKIQILLHPEQNSISLPNPISPEMSVMRLSLWTGLLTAVINNQNNKQQRVRLFESGLCFTPDCTAELGIRQDNTLSGIVTGTRFNEHWDQNLQKIDFYDVKGDLEALFELIGKLKHIEFKSHYHPALHPKQSAAIYLEDILIGFIGAIHPILKIKLNLTNHIIIFEIFWEKITKINIPKFTEISHFPISRRDISIVVKENFPAANIISECKKTIKNKLIDINLIDVYRGNKIAKGFKSLTISLILQNANSTLQEKEITTIITQCVLALKQRFQASLRD